MGRFVCVVLGACVQRLEACVQVREEARRVGLNSLEPELKAVENRLR